MANIAGTPDHDDLIGTNENDVIQGLGGNDTLRGLEGDDLLEGGEGNDRLFGGGGTDRLVGGAGDDIYVVEERTDFVVEDSEGGFDVVYATGDYTLSVGSHVERLSAIDWRFTGAIHLTGNELVNIIEGNAGNNTLDGGGGADRLIGFRGDDVYLVDDAGDVVIEKAGEGFDIVYVDDDYALTAGSAIEVLAAGDPTATADLRLTGNELANTIVGNAGDNLINGNGGLDSLYGLGGDDIYVVHGGTVVEAENDGFDIVYAAAAFFTLAENSFVEVLSTIDWSQITAIDLTGNSFANLLEGNAGRNVLDGGGGADVMYGFGGDDIYLVDNAADQVIEAAGAGADEIRTTVSYRLAAGAHVELLTAAVGSSLALTGNAFSNTLQGNGGNDLLNGDGGADVMIGGNGNDTYIVENSNDVVTENSSGGDDVVFTTVDYQLAGGNSFDPLVETLSSIDWSLALGLRLTGNAGRNNVHGDAGNNYIDGRGGLDQLIGHGGSDTFAFTTALDTANRDRILDFAPADDRMALEDSIFTTLSAGALSASAFVRGTAATSADHRIIYNPGTGAVLYDRDGSGSATAIQFATIGTQLDLQASDFVVV